MNRRAGRAMRAVALVAALVGAAPAQAADGDQDFVAGSATNMLAELTPFAADLRLTAHAFDDELPTLGGLFGARDVAGHAVGSGELPNGAFLVEGEVTCLKVVGNRATVKYRFAQTQGPGAPPPGWGVQVFIEDNGPPSDGVPDANATDAPLPPELFDPQADQCELPRGPFNPVDAGDYVVRDGDAP
jgi:hypothetical protein